MGVARTKYILVEENWMALKRTRRLEEHVLIDRVLSINR